MKISKILSFIFHPIFIPTYSLFLIFMLVPYFSDFTTISQKKQIIELSVIFTLLLPILSILVLKKIKVIDSLSMENKEERRWPLLFTIGWNYMLFNLLVTIQAHYLIIRLILGAMLILFIAIIISNFWKISLHMLGIGGLVGVFCALNFLLGGYISLIVILLFFSGLVGYSRINENAHNLNQIYCGFIIGVIIELTLLVF